MRRSTVAVAVFVVTLTACGDGGPAFDAREHPGYTEEALERAFRRYNQALADEDVDVVLELTSDRCPTDRDAMRDFLADLHDFDPSTTIPTDVVLRLHRKDRGEVEWTTEVDAQGSPMSGGSQDWIFDEGQGWRAFPCAISSDGPP